MANFFDYTKNGYGRFTYEEWLQRRFRNAPDRNKVFIFLSHHWSAYWFEQTSNSINHFLLKMRIEDFWNRFGEKPNFLGLYHVESSSSIQLAHCMNIAREGELFHPDL